MSPANGAGSADGAQPLVLAVTETPLLLDLLRELLEDVAVVRHFPARSADLEGLVRHTMPDALVVDGDDDTLELTAVAEELSLPLVQILLPLHEIRVCRDGLWDPMPLPIASPTTIRNLLVGELFHAPVHVREPLPGIPAHRDHGMEP